MIQASECKCCVCGKQAVAFWPVIDPDIPEYPYCRKCLDDVKTKTIMNLYGIDPTIAKTIIKSQNDNQKSKQKREKQ